MKSTYKLGKTALGSHLKEGIVIKPLKERVDLKVGRVQLKLVSSEYLLNY